MQPYDSSTTEQRLGIAAKPTAYSWRQVAGAGALAGIGFTMSLFIAGEAFPDETEFAAAKIAISVDRRCPGDHDSVAQSRDGGGEPCQCRGF